MTPRLLVRLARSLAAALVVATLAAWAIPAAAKTMIYVPESYGYTGSWYVVLRSDATARLVGEVGAKPGTYTDDGTEILVSLNKPLSYEFMSKFLDCNGLQYTQRRDVKQVLFRRVDGTNVNKGKSRVVEIGEVVDVTGCTPGAKTAFGSVSDEGFAMLHRSADKREPMTDVVAGLTIAGLRELPRPDPYYSAYVSLEADVVTFDTDTSVHFQRSGHVVNATMTSDQWLVLDMPTFQRGYTRVSINTSNGIETWLEATFKDGKPQTVTNVLISKPILGASFGTNAATSRLWESGFFVGSNNPFFFYLYRDFTGERVEKDLAAATEFHIPITWRYEGLDVVTSRTSSGTLIERRWTPLGRTNKSMALMEQEIRTPSGGTPYVFIPARLNFYMDRGAAYPPAP